MRRSLSLKKRRSSRNREDLHFRWINEIRFYSYLENYHFLSFSRESCQRVLVPCFIFECFKIISKINACCSQADYHADLHCKNAKFVFFLVSQKAERKSGQWNVRENINLRFNLNGFLNGFLFLPRNSLFSRASLKGIFKMNFQKTWIDYCLYAKTSFFC